MSNMFDGCSKLVVNCSNWNVSKVIYDSRFNASASGVVLPKAWQTSATSAADESRAVTLNSKQEDNAIRSSDGAVSDEAASQTGDDLAAAA